MVRRVNPLEKALPMIYFLFNKNTNWLCLHAHKQNEIHTINDQVKANSWITFTCVAIVAVAWWL